MIGETEGGNGGKETDRRNGRKKQIEGKPGMDIYSFTLYPVCAAGPCTVSILRKCSLSEFPAQRYHTLDCILSILLGIPYDSKFGYINVP